MDVPWLLPKHVDEQLNARIEWLHNRLTTFDDAVAVPFPTIEIVPAFPQYVFEDGSYIWIEAMVGARPVSNRGVQYVIGLSAPALIAFGEHLLAGLLAHEFLHVVHKTLRAERARRVRQPLRGINDGREAGVSFERNRSIDAQSRVSPVRWLNSYLLEQLIGYDDSEDQNTISARREMHGWWFGQDLPTFRHGGKYESPEDIVLDRQIIERAAEFGELSA